MCVGLLIAILAAPVAIAEESTSPFSFEAWAPKDTFLTFEKINYEMRVRNISDTMVACRLPLNDCNAWFRVFDTSGVEIPHLMTSCCGPTGDIASLEPGDSAVTWMGVHVDRQTSADRKELGYEWVPSGAYRCVFNWVYDPLQSNYANGAGQMFDTVSLWVVSPQTGVDSHVMESYLNSIRGRRLDRFREIADSFPSSTYAKQLRQEYIVDLHQRVSVGDYDRQAATDYALKFIVDYPNDFDATRFVHYFSNGGCGRDQRLFLREVRSLVPDTRAAERAKQLLDHPEGRFSDLWDQLLGE